MKKNPTTIEFDLSAEDVEWKRILVPVNFSDSSVRALNYAVPLARRSGAKLVLLHVVQLPILPAALAMGALGNVKEAHKTLTNEAKAPAWMSSPTTVGAMGVTTHHAVTVGTAWDEKSSGAKRLDCDLVVISTHGHNTLTRMLSSNTANTWCGWQTAPLLCVRG